MSAPKLALFAGFVAAALLAALWWQHEHGVPLVEPAAVSSDVARPVRTTVESPRPSAASPPTAAVPASPQAAPTGMRATEAELRGRVAEGTYARFGDVLVDHLVARGLAQVDGELVVRRFFEDNARCLFDALHAEADAQSVAYESVLDAFEAELYDADGPLLGGLIDLRAVQDRVVPCALAAMQQAGFEESALPETARAELILRAR